MNKTLKKRKIRVRITSKAKNAVLSDMVDNCGSILIASALIGVSTNTFSAWLNFRRSPKLVDDGGKRRRGGGLSFEKWQQVIVALERETGKDVSEIFCLTKAEMGLFRDVRSVTKEIDSEQLLRHMGHREIGYESNLGQNIEGDEAKDALRKAIKCLSCREREIINLRYGLKDGYSHTYEEIGHIFSLSRERVRQIEARAIRKLQMPENAAGLVGHVEQMTRYRRDVTHNRPASKGPYLPECTCETRTENDELCLVHARGARKRELKRAYKAMKRGKVKAADYYAWLEKYREPTPKIRWSNWP